MLANISRRVELTGSDPRDSEDLRMRKITLMRMVWPFAIAGFVWGIVYMLFDEPGAGLIPFLYGVVSVLSIVVFALTRRFRLFRTFQLVLILVLPYLLMMSLGGFVSSSAVILWSIICPIGALVFSLLYFFINQLHQEQRKTNELLLNVLPGSIVPLLKDPAKQTIARHHDSVSILFADVVGFTQLSLKLSPTEMLELLNEVFSYFDSLIDRWQVEKIRTIGDNYMVVAGAPRQNPDHAQILARIALDMLAYLEDPRNLAHSLLQFRIGINSGSIIAGVIGQTKFHYDVWGDAVNTASRMESHGVPNRIQITNATRDLLADDFICQSRGMVDIKGKGLMETWFVEAERGARA